MGGTRAEGKRRQRPAGGPGARPRWRGQEFLALALIGAALFLTISALSFRLSDPDDPLAPGVGANWGGIFGYHLGGFFLETFGLACYPFFGFVVYWGVLLLLRRELPKPVMRVAGALGLMLVLSIVLAGPELRGARQSTPFGLGGVLGLWLAPKLHFSFGGLGVFVLLFVTGMIAFLVAADWPLHELAAGVRDLVPERRTDRRQRESRLAWRRAFTATFARIRDLFAPAVATVPDAAMPDVEEVEVAVDAGGVEVAPVRVRRRRTARAPEEPPEAEALEAPAPAHEPAPAVPAPAEPRAKPAASDADKPKLEQRSLPIQIAEATGISAVARRRRPKGRYVFPPLDLLERSETMAVADEEGLRRAAEAIERRLASHNVEARVVCISAGPAVTVFELELAEGLRVGSMTGYAPDLAAALKAYSVRIVAPIPGKHTVGVEVPNARRSLVRLRELCELREPGKIKETVPLFLGRDVAGKPLIEDLARMPHLLIAGATGSGKSVCINSILLSILLTKSPDEVRVILIDPKMVELQNYKTIPHLLCPVVTSMKQVPRVLEWAVETMEQRYSLLSAAGVRNLKDYNALGETKLRERFGERFDPERTPVQMPTIVAIIDEFADLMAVAASEIEVSIQRLAQKSRAVGIHVILATQRPSRDVITGLIKANLPTRVSFQVSSRVDSRVVLDHNGAEQLLGNGDFLFIPPGTHRLVRAQGSFVSDDEIHAVVSFLEQRSHPQDFEEALIQLPTGGGRSPRERDDLYDDAVRVVLEEQRGSATLLQRKLSIGYTRASRLIELMSEDGLVGEFVGSKSREVLMTLEEWEAQRELATESASASDAAATTVASVQFPEAETPEPDVGVAEAMPEAGEPAAAIGGDDEDDDDDAEDEDELDGYQEYDRDEGEDCEEEDYDDSDVDEDAEDEEEEEEDEEEEDDEDEDDSWGDDEDDDDWEEDDEEEDEEEE